MIIEYHRPENLEQAKRLLNREKPLTIPLGGGTVISRFTEEPIAVVDLQSLGLNKIAIENSKCRIGSMVRLQDLVENSNIPAGLAKAAQREASINIRRSATIGGMLMTSDGISPLLGCLLALDVRLFWEPGNKSMYLGEWLAKDRKKNPEKLISGIEFAIPVEVDYDDVARSPEDKPQVYVTAAKWGTGEIRVVMGGSGKAPILGSDGSKNLVSDIFNRYTYATSMERAAYTDYQQAAIRTLIDRMIPQKGIFGGKGLL
jgi:CO/xanthine dehydrogenase FAD-binding subunit